MTVVSVDLLSAAIVIAALSWFAVGRGMRTLEVCARPATTGLLLLTTLVLSPRIPDVYPFLVQAVFFAFLGDIAMVSESRSPLVAIATNVGRTRTMPVSDLKYGPGTGFVLGLVCLSVSNAFLGLAMAHHSSDEIGTVFGLVLVLITIFSFGYRVIIGAQQSGGAPMAIGVALYMVVLGGMVVVGVGTASLFAAYGSVLLALSSLVLSGDRLVSARPWTPTAVLVLYHLAMVSIVVGLAR